MQSIANSKINGGKPPERTIVGLRFAYPTYALIDSSMKSTGQ
jgi:hypothetical protein